MAVAAILNLSLPILVTWSISSSDWLHFCKIALIYLNQPLSVQKSKMAADAI